MHSILALDYMIKNDLWKYNCNSWCGEPTKSHFWELCRINKKGQFNYDDNIFVITFFPSIPRMGGMDCGTPPSYSIIRIKQKEEPCPIPADPDQKLNITCAYCGKPIDFRNGEVFVNKNKTSYVCHDHIRGGI